MKSAKPGSSKSPAPARWSLAGKAPMGVKSSEATWGKETDRDCPGANYHHFFGLSPVLAPSAGAGGLGEDNGDSGQSPRAGHGAIQGAGDGEGQDHRHPGETLCRSG